MKEQKQIYKPVHLTPEYHKRLAIFAINKGVTKKKAVEELIDAATDNAEPQKELSPIKPR